MYLAIFVALLCLLILVKAMRHGLVFTNRRQSHNVAKNSTDYNMVTAMLILGWGLYIDILIF